MTRPTVGELLQTEAEFQAAVVELALRCGCLVWHDFDSRKNAAGFPDLVIVHPNKRRVLFVELKSERGRVRPEQQEWIDAINAVPRYVERAQELSDVAAYVWRPSDWPAIEDVLR